jgi:hypothetical protein
VIPGQSSSTSKMNGSSQSVSNATDVLTKTSGSDNANKEGNKIWPSKMPKFIVKPKSTPTDPIKKQKTETTAGPDTGKAPVAEENSEPAQNNVLQSLCQNYDSDESE